MRTGVRPFALILTLAWIAAWCGILWMMWRPASEARITLSDFAATATITTGGLARVVATLVSLVAIALALPVLISAALPYSPRTVVRPKPAAAEPSAPLATHEDAVALRTAFERLGEDIRQLRDQLRASGERAATPPEQMEREPATNGSV
jgi:hypothetical protein